MKSTRKRTVWVAVAVAGGLGLAALGLVAALSTERFQISVFERAWRSRLAAMQQPEEVRGLGERHGAGDWFAKRYPDGGWLAGVSASSCGNGFLPDLLLIREESGRIHAVTGEHFCGKGGIVMAIPELEGEAYASAVEAIAARVRGGEPGAMAPAGAPPAGR